MTSTIKSCDLDLLWVTALLLEIGYIHKPLKNANTTDLKIAIKHLQKSTKVSQTGRLDEKTWKKLTKVRLSNRMKEQIGKLQCYK